MTITDAEPGNQEATADQARSPIGISEMLPALLPAPALGVVALIVYAVAIDSGGVLANAALVAGCAFLAGGFLGFLFGIPRSLAGERPANPSGSGTPTATPTSSRTARSGYETNT